MSVHVLMLRGINIGSRRMAMADLRTLLSEAGYGAVRTYVQSGNVVLDAAAGPGEVERHTSRLISERCGFEVPVIARSAQRLAAVVALDPLGEVAADPKRHQVTFLSAPLALEPASRLQALVAGGERLVVAGSELFTWHPDGIARSKLAVALGARWLGVSSTTRNWTTVATLLEMAS
jgi:uncharacterized protein (DUF1697 family)